MRNRSVLLASAVAVLLGACASHQTPKPSLVALSDCGSIDSAQVVAPLYQPGNVKEVEPTYRQEFLARAIQPRYVSGASLYIPAQAGMSRAYLQRALTCHAATGASLHPNDPLRVEGVASVTVSEAGPALRIAVVGTDRKSGKAIWNRARALHGQQGEVTVEQLSAAPVEGARF